jgi:hypothetical protein
MLATCKVTGSVYILVCKYSKDVSEFLSNFKLINFNYIKEEMHLTDNNISEQFRLTGIVYSALIFGMIIFFAIALFLVESKKFEPVQSIDEILKLLIPLVGFAVMYFARVIYKKNISSVNFHDDLLSKFSRYRTFKIIQWSLVESVGFLSVVAFIITGNYFYTIVFLFMLGFFVLIKPTKEEFFRDLKISSEQKTMFSKK